MHNKIKTDNFLVINSKSILLYQNFFPINDRVNDEYFHKAVKRSKFTHRHEMWVELKSREICYTGLIKHYML